jgi:hypothetical protein
MAALWGATRDFGTVSSSVLFVFGMAGRSSFLVARPAVAASSSPTANAIHQ